MNPIYPGNKLIAILSLQVMVLFGLCSMGRSAEITIEMFDSIFLPETVSIDVGDTVKWVLFSGDHTVTSGLPDGKPETVNEPGVLFDGIVNIKNPVFEFTFNEFRKVGFFFFDRNQPGQIGFVKINSGQITVRVAVVDNLFNPPEVAIFEGDSILWEHEFMEDAHTVTSGLSSNLKDNPGLLFDEDSTDENPIFVYQFTSPGDYPYFCRPHEHMGMTGRVIVQRIFIRGDVSSDGAVNIADAIATLGVLFLGKNEPLCKDSMDANDDGKINIADPTSSLNFLFLGSNDLPAPFPAPGADRTEDTLRCDFKKL